MRGAAPRGERGGQLRCALADELVDRVVRPRVLVVRRGQLPRLGERAGALGLLRVADEQLRGGPGRALRRREVRELHHAVHSLELAQQLLGVPGGRLRVERRYRHGDGRGRLHALHRMRDVVEDGQIHLLLQPVGEDIFCNKKYARLKTVLSKKKVFNFRD